MLFRHLHPRRDVVLIQHVKVAFSIALLVSALGLFAFVLACSASTEDPVFGTRLPDIGAETESPTPVLTVATLTPTPDRGYVATPESEMQTVAAVQSTTQTPIPAFAETPTSIATPTLIPPYLPTATPISLDIGESGMTEEELAAARQQMLELINAGRLENGLNPVELDDNPSSQLHANDMVARCFLSQWGTDGSKPTLRYNVEGGIHASYSFVWGITYCLGDPSWFDPSRLIWEPPIADEVAGEVSAAYRSLSEDFGLHESTFKRVGIGLSYRIPDVWVSLVFATDHLRYIEEPRLENGILTFAYELMNGASAGEGIVDAYVHYDVPLRSLNRGQLARTASSGLGRRIAGIRPPAGADSYWTEDEFSVDVSTCGDPYAIDADLDPPDSYDAADALWRRVSLLCEHETPSSAIAKWVTSGVERFESGIRVTSDLQDLVSQFGAGIYTLQIWAVVDGTDAPVSEYSIFVE